MPVRPCGNFGGGFNFSGEQLYNSGGGGGGGSGGSPFGGQAFECANDIDQVYTRIPTGAWNNSPQGFQNEMCDQNSPNYGPQVRQGGQPPGRNMGFPQGSPNLNRSPQDPRNQSCMCNENTDQSSANIGRPIRPSDFFSPPTRAPNRGTHLTMATQIPQNQYDMSFGETSYLNLPECAPPGRQMNVQQESPNFNAFPPGAYSTPNRGPQASYPQQSGPRTPMGLQQQQRRQPLSEVKVSSAGRAFNSGDKCCDDSPALEGLRLSPIDVGYVEPGSPQWISLYMANNYTYVPDYYQPKNSSAMRNRSPSSNRYDCDPPPEQNRNANCDPNANQQLYRNQAFQGQQSPCQCPRPGASGNQPRQMQPWNQPDFSPPRMPGSRDRSFSPSGGAPCPCPSGTGAGAQSNVNIARNQPGGGPLPCPPPQQQVCCPRPMGVQQQQQQKLQQLQQQQVQQMQKQQQQQQQARWNSPDCSPTRGVAPTRSNASLRPSGAGATSKASGAPKTTASGLSMRELCNRKLRELQMENLVRDQYIPGVIQETLDGCENFNCISFDLTLGQEAPDDKPQVDPLTLIEAFAMRIDYERNQVNCARERNAAGKEKETDPEKIKKNEKQEIEKYFACQNDSELNRAIAGLLRAERIEELTNDVKPLFATEINKKETVLPGSELNNFQDLTMITYTSTTKPI